MSGRGPESIRVGPAGWSYADWVGRIHPRGTTSAGSTETPSGLERMLAIFGCVEINVSFYRDPPAAMQHRWIATAAAHPDARLPLKLHQRFTHASLGDRAATPRRAPPLHPELDLDAELAAWRHALAPWIGAAQRGPLLVQFPFSFASEARRERYALELIDRLATLVSGDVVVELRRREWHEPPLRERILATGASLVAIDLPPHDAHPGVPHDATAGAGPIGYLRLHGRNAAKWFARQATRDERYDYLYSREEIGTLADRARSLAERSRETYVVTNNHYGGQAVANAVELLAALGAPPRGLPALWVQSFPHLAAIAPAIGQGRLY